MEATRLKVFIKALLVNFALIIIGAYGIPSILWGDWEQAELILQLLLVTVIIRFLMLLTNKFIINNMIVGYVLELAMTLAVVLGFNAIFQWYALRYLWGLILTVVLVYIVAIILDIARTRRDVAFINEQIKLRRKTLSQHEKER